jgi:hypothetical protein
MGNVRRSSLPLLALLLCIPLVHATESGIGFQTVAAALAALRENTAARATVEGGWTGFYLEEAGNPVVWSFTPPDHPAHPAAVKRTLILSGDTAIKINLEVLCEATKASCDSLVEQFREHDKAIVESVRHGT